MKTGIADNRHFDSVGGNRQTLKFLWEFCHHRPVEDRISFGPAAI